MDQHQHSTLVPYTGVYDIYWREIMSWYPFDGVSFLIRRIVLHEPSKVRDIECFSWQGDVGWPLISISARLQHDENDLDLCQGLDWRKVMSWYATSVATIQSWSYSTTGVMEP